MPFVLSRPRTAALFAVVVLIVGAAALGDRGRPSPVGVHGVAVSVIDLPRPAWFAMRVVGDHAGFVPRVVPAGQPPAMSALGGILVDVDAGTILWEHDAHAKLPPASTTKILTALVALENFSPSRRVAITTSALHQAPDETRMGLAAGQTLTVEELLTGMLLVSGNDAAAAIAEDTVGTDRFVAAMNAQVRALGLHDSHVTNPIGLDDPAHYSSAYDLAVLSAFAVRHFPLFGQIVAMRAATLPVGTGHPDFSLQSINTLLTLYPPAVGIKPGWTPQAGYCEVGMAVRDGRHLISVLLNAPYGFSQSRRLLDWGFVQEGLASTLPPPTAVPSPHG